MELLLVCLNFVLLHLIFVQSSNITQVESLYSNLFNNYNRKLFPLIDHNNTVDISCSVGIVSINNFDELSGEIELTVLFFMQWADERLTWTPSNFGGKSTLLVPPEDVWHPQLYVLQSFDKIQEISNMSLMIRLYADGRVVWNPGSVLKIVCSVDVTYFPFDAQTCSFTVAGWAYQRDEVNFYARNGTVSEDFYGYSSQWKIESANVMNYSVSPTFPPSINVKAVLKRRSDFFMVYIIIPMVFLGSINTLVFAMPANSGERTSVAITTFLSFIVFMQMVNDIVPQSSAPMAYIYYYILFLLVYSSMILFLCILSLRIYDKEIPVHPVVEKSINCLRFWCFKKTKNSVITPDLHISRKRTFSNASDNVDVKSVLLMRTMYKIKKTKVVKSHGKQLGKRLMCTALLHYQ